MSVTISDKKRRENLHVTGSLSATPVNLGTAASKFVVQDTDMEFKYRDKDQMQSDLDIDWPIINVTNDAELDAAFVTLNAKGYGDIVVTEEFTLANSKNYNFTGITVRGIKKAIIMNDYHITASAGGPIFKDVTFYGIDPGDSMTGTTKELFCSNGAGTWTFDNVGFNNVVGSTSAGDSSNHPVINVLNSLNWQSIYFNNCRVSSEGATSYDNFSIGISDTTSTYLFVFVNNQKLSSQMSLASARYELIGTQPTAKRVFQSDATAYLHANPNDYEVYNVMNTKSLLTDPVDSDRILVEDSSSGQLKYLPLSEVTGSGGGNVEPPTVDGQLLYADISSDPQWLHTETSQLRWVDSTQRFGVRTATPLYDFHVTGLSCYQDGIIVNNEQGDTAETNDFVVRTKAEDEAFIVAGKDRISTNVDTRLGGAHESHYTQFKSGSGHQTMLGDAKAGMSLWCSATDLMVVSSGSAQKGNLILYNQTTPAIELPYNSTSQNMTACSFIMPYFKTDYNTLIQEVFWLWTYGNTTPVSNAVIACTSSFSFRNPGDDFGLYTPMPDVEIAASYNAWTGYILGYTNKLMQSSVKIFGYNKNVEPDGIIGMKFIRDSGGRPSNDTYSGSLYIFGIGLKFRATQIGHPSGSAWNYYPTSAW